MIESFHRSGDSSLFQIELISLWISESLVLFPAFLQTMMFAAFVLTDLDSLRTSRHFLILFLFSPGFDVFIYVSASRIYILAII
jgi:hypothetical protein